MANEAPEISLIIPTYNCAEYLPACLDSILNQTYSDYEIVLIDDGSTDSTRNVIEQYQAKNPQVKFSTCYQENHGAGHARNVGMDLCTGKYVAFIDGDDLLLPDYLETLYHASQDYSADLVTCGYEKFETDTGKIVEIRDARDWTAHFPDGTSHVFQYSPCAKLIKRTLLEEHHLRFFEGEIMEDGPFGVLTNSLANNQVVLPYRGYQYRVHSGSVQDGVRKTGLSRNENGRLFPFNGFSKATEIVLETKGDSYYRALEYSICKALAGFAFFFCKNGTKEDLKYTCEQCYEMVERFFPKVRKGSFISISICKNLPLSYRAAISLFKFCYLHRCLYPVARCVQLTERFIGF